MSITHPAGAVRRVGLSSVPRARGRGTIIGVGGQCVMHSEQCVEEQDALAGTTFIKGKPSEGDEAFHDGRIAA